MLHHSLRLLRLTFCFYDGNHKEFQLQHSILTSSSHTQYTAVQAGIRRLETSATRAFPNDSILVLGEHERIQLLFRNLHGVVRLMETAIYCLRVTKLFCPERFRDSQISMKRHKSLHSGAILMSQLRNQFEMLQRREEVKENVKRVLERFQERVFPGSNVRPSGEMLKRASWSRRFQEISP
ncbi:hypothetical protein ALC53_06290 [Atta colombica]|uniref:Uncharacterized protein n=1 Tax=Atta colombica TaxID=520822 RepID=A0A195BFT2_9HYME|nr:hypothetical protein ALC53_06290 [Atta colombica]